MLEDLIDAGKWIIKHPIKSLVATVGITGFLYSIYSQSFPEGIKWKIEDYFATSKDTRMFVSDPNRQIPVTERYSGDVRPTTVWIGEYLVESRDTPLYCTGATTCAILIIDDPLSKKHYLGEWDYTDDPSKIKASIGDNFSNLSQSNFYILQGSYGHTESINHLYGIMGELGLTDKVYFIPRIRKEVPGLNKHGSGIVIHRGELSL